VIALRSPKRRRPRRAKKILLGWGLTLTSWIVQRSNLVHAQHARNPARAQLTQG
jgi:hypothetical protein